MPRCWVAVVLLFVFVDRLGDESLRRKGEGGRRRG
jgi:hypothetical protein